MLFSLLFANKRNISNILSEDLYEDLGLKNGATIRDINRSYKRFAKYYSQIQNPSVTLQNQWNHVQHAVEILSDNKTSKLYDQFGTSIFAETDFSVSYYKSNLQIAALKELESDLPNRKLNYGGIITFPIQFQLSDFMTGSQKNLTIIRDVPCICKNGGKKCAKCRKVHSTKESILYQVFLKPGTEEFSLIYAPGIGDSSKLRGAQDIVFIPYSIPQPNFYRKNSDLHANLTIPISKALAGDKYTFKSLNNESIILDFGNGVKDGDQIIMSGFGFPNYDNPQTRGDLIITIKVSVPKFINPDKKKIISQILSDEIIDYE